MQQKIVPDLFKILVNNPKQLLHPSNSFKRNPVPFNRQAYKKQKEPETTDHSLFRLQNKFRKIPLLVMYYLTKFDDVI